jgi:hypothetical protein
MRNSGAFTPTRVPFGFVFILILLRLLPGQIVYATTSPYSGTLRLKVRRTKRRQRPRLGLFYFRRMVLEEPNNKKATTVFSFLFAESGLTEPLLVELFYGVQIHNPVVRGSAPAL